MTERSHPPGAGLDRLPKGIGACIAGIEEGSRPGTFTAQTVRRDTARRLLAIMTLILIVGSIWYLQSGRGLPWQGSSGPASGGLRAGGIRQDGHDAFVRFDSQGIKLGAAGETGPKLGAAAPDFTLLDLSGKPVKLSDLRGQTVLINFWATWCLPCRQEFPELVKLDQANGDRGLIVLGVDNQEGEEVVRDFADQYRVRYPIVIDKAGDVTKQYRVIGLPTTWFIDSTGILRAQFLGPLTPDLISKKLAETGFSMVKK